MGKEGGNKWAEINAHHEKMARERGEETGNKEEEIRNEWKEQTDERLLTTSPEELLAEYEMDEKWKEVAVRQIRKTQEQCEESSQEKKGIGSDFKKYAACKTIRATIEMATKKGGK